MLQGESNESSMDPFEIYISSPPVPTISDPLAYWDSQQKAGVDSGLAQMALDYLSIPRKPFLYLN